MCPGYVVLAKFGAFVCFKIKNTQTRFETIKHVCRKLLHIFLMFFNISKKKTKIF